MCGEEGGGGGGKDQHRTFSNVTPSGKEGKLYTSEWFGETLLARLSSTDK